MHQIAELAPSLAAYQPSLLVLVALCLIVLVQSFLCAPLAFIKQEQQPGIPLRGDHDHLSFRVLRTHANSVESLSPLGFALLLAVLIGVSPSLTNWLCLIHLGFRIAFWAVYYSGVGKAAGGPRTLCYVGGLIANFILLGACGFEVIS